jgi:hypothetical protein
MKLSQQHCCKPHVEQQCKDCCYVSKAEFSVLITLLPLPILYTNIQFIQYGEYHMLLLERTTGEYGSGTGFSLSSSGFPSLSFHQCSFLVLPTCCSYQDKRAKLGSLGKCNPLSEIMWQWTEMQFHCL